MKLEVQVERDCVRFGDDFSLRFQRTLRIPDDGKTYPLPPGLGAFPVRRVDDYESTVPSEWLDRGGVFLPMYQREAMWLSFSASVPHAVKVAVGKVCALTGERWRERLSTKKQNYVVAPNQPWLDGICVGRGRIRQFVAMPLGLGYTVEGQVTGEETFGGIQVKVVAPQPGRFPRVSRARMSAGMAFGAMPPPACAAPAGACAAGSMGLSAGGRMKQKVYPDPYGIDTWNTSASGRLYVHIVTSELWREITGESPPSTPVTAKEYARRGLPWFDLYDEHQSSLSGSAVLEDVLSVKELDAEKSGVPLQDDESVPVGPLKKLWNALTVRDGNW
jgi:hypothetical protein